MDWKAFVASVVGSLAWPLVLAYFLFLFRDQLMGLPGRIEELTLPGGAGIKLARQVDKVRDQAEIVEVEEGLPPPDVLALDPAILQLAQLFPEAAVVQGFKELEGVILQIRSRLPDGRPHRNLVEVMRRLIDLGYISESVLALFVTLREARNTAAHARGENKMTPSEAIELVRQTKLLTQLLTGVLGRLPQPGATPTTS